MKYILIGCLILAGWFSYNHWYVPYENLKNGFLIVKGFNCPDYHSIKANKNSMIYHVPGSTYYKRTSADSGYCFDSSSNAEKQGFRKPRN